MSTDSLHIKNMVCPRCVEAVKNILDSENIDYASVTLGLASLNKELEAETHDKLKLKLEDKGFEIVLDKEQVSTEMIKAEIIELVHHSDQKPIENTSDYLSKKLNQPYYRLSKAFKSKTGQTIEKYIIHQKIERVKELISYKELNATEIAYTLGYSSLQHLSNQFKSVTGLSLREYKSTEYLDRRNIDAV